jgi:hypothetical protein
MDVWRLGELLNIQYQLLETFEKSWNHFATRIIDELDLWCKNSGITHYGLGYTQIAIQITFAYSADAMLFKLRWYNA